MRILLIGVTGFTGGNIARELAARGHEVVGVARTVAGAEAPATELRAGDVYDAGFVADAARGADAVAVAVPPAGDGRELREALPGLLDAATAVGARLGIVGGASSLRRGPDGPLVFDGMPESIQRLVRPLIDVLEALRADDRGVDWFFLSPPENYGSHRPGERRGSYRTGVDELVVEEGTGRSHIGGEDYALAFADELETPAHRRMRFTVGY